MILDAYQNLKYKNYKILFSFSFPFSKNTNSGTIPNIPLNTAFYEMI